MISSISRAQNIIYSFFILGFFWAPQKAAALPFQKNCNSMQTYFNARFKKNKSGEDLSYSNFELGDMVNFGVYLVCQDGFITKSGPQGIEVCKGFIKYTPPGGPLSWGIMYGDRQPCRWK